MRGHGVGAAGGRDAVQSTTRLHSLGGGTEDNGRMHVPTDAFGGMSPEYKVGPYLLIQDATRAVDAQSESTP